LTVATLPVIVQVVSDEADALAQAVQCARDRHLVAVSPRATRLYYLLKLARRSASRLASPNIEKMLLLKLILCDKTSCSCRKRLTSVVKTVWIFNSCSLTI